jgi:hypothetical protein
MSMRFRLSIILGVLLLGVIGISSRAAAQPDGLLSGNIKYNAGQTVQPIFEGWTKNADGSFNLFFGYLNRNHVQELHVPVGPENQIEPGGPDRGQPTYFYTRFNRQLFSVTVPANWGQKEVIWTLVTNGRSERAVGWLRPDWEISPPGLGRGSDAGKNDPPALSLAAEPRAALAVPLKLTATITDDGLPAPRNPAAGRGRGRAAGPPAFEYGSKTPPPVNVPQVERAQRPRVTDRLQVEWFVWRGPAAAAFSPQVAGADKGPAEVTATFSRPGEYVLRARATDSGATVTKDVKVVVSGTPQ